MDRAHVGGVKDLRPMADELAGRAGAHLGVMVDGCEITTAADGKLKVRVPQRFLNSKAHGVLCGLRTSCPKCSADFI
jgi:hypothetical protein